jgi:hypothetical protein
MDTKYRPAASRLTVTVVTRAAAGIVREKRMGSASSILASLSTLPSQRKALLVYSAACRSCLDLKDGYFARLAKKLVNAVCRWRSDCCSGTELTSPSHSSPGVFFSAVSAAEVW